MLTWQTDWYGEVGAYAHGADAGEDTGYWYVIGNDTSTTTSAQVPGALSESGYAVTDGSQVAITPGAALAAGARVDIALRSREQPGGRVDADR